jgi:glycosyltransferase involved in cell wall biosynthesis
MKLHIISSDVPFPPDYGGMVDVYYKIKNLHEAGVKIYLHCFEYGRGEPVQMKDYCEDVFYYKRKTGLKGLSLRLPYMMYSRRDDNLLNNLINIDAPILFEGVHTTYYLSHPALEQRFKLMRNQNLEQEYYTLLAKRETNPAKKFYYKTEAKLLKIKESRLDAADVFLTVAEHDHDFFKEAYPQKQHAYIPSFQPYNEVKSLPGKGKYVLYHGNLGHPENVEAALFLLNEVCPHLDIPFIFAGKDPSSKIADACNNLKNCGLISNPDMKGMENLIANAQVHLLPTFQATGLKLKLLHALFNGRHIVVNEAMVAGTGLSDICNVATDANDFIEKTKKLFDISFDEQTIHERNKELLKRYNNLENAKRIIAFLEQEKK